MPLLALCLAISVHDGDTIRCDGEKVRIANIDAPEMRDSARCSPASVARLARSLNPAWCDHAKAAQSRDALRSFLSRGAVAIQRQGTDRYGRTLATLSVNGQDAGAYLVMIGLARWWQ